ncbi:hypothetical protein OG552_18420 [Streptomyces sp. NBC_01476]|uniref:hypothetical protein n=1 Tax=Streptomyces sp. NBC_01476 TaxID=2903881 RepID=UPI002E33BBF5|nr:hypothetical protein [Streptomyces sp. NBC_01476]
MADGQEPTTAPAATGAAGRTDAPPRSVIADEPVRRVLRVLPLGAGLVLVGLGLGFFGLRLRRS